MSESDDRLRDIGEKLSQVASVLSSVAADMQGGSSEEGATFRGGGVNRLGKVQLQPLAGQSVSRLRESLKTTLNSELARGGNSLGLQPGDLVAISSSVGQSISF